MIMRIIYEGTLMISEVWGRAQWQIYRERLKHYLSSYQVWYRNYIPGVRSIISYFHSSVISYQVLCACSKSFNLLLNLLNDAQSDRLKFPKLCTS